MDVFVVEPDEREIERPARARHRGYKVTDSAAKINGDLFNDPVDDIG